MLLSVALPMTAEAQEVSGRDRGPGVLVAGQFEQIGALTLPRTGGVPVEVMTIAGIMVTALGFRLRRSIS